MDPDPFSEPPQLSTSVVIAEPPRKSRKLRLIASAVIALAVIGGVVFAVTRSDDAPAKYSLSSASDATDEVRSMTFITTTSGFGNEVVAEIDADVEHGLMHMTMDLGSDVVGIGGEMEMIIDIDNQVTYINESFFDALGIPLDTEWLRMDAEWMAENGEDTVFNAEGVGNPLDATVALDKAVKTEEVGFDTVDDVKVKHYRVTFRSEDVFVTNGQLESQLDELNGDIPEELVYDFYIDEQNLVRRVTYQIDIGSGEVTTDIVILSINEPLQIDVPDEEDVTDARDFL